MKLINKIELENDELLEYKNGLRRNVLQCMNILTGQLKPHELEYEKPESQVNRMDNSTIIIIILVFFFFFFISIIYYFYCYCYYHCYY